VFDTTGGTAKIELTHTNPANSVATTIIKTAATPVNTTAATLNTNPALAVAEITTTAAKAAATAVGVTLDAYVGGSSEQTIYLYATNSSASAENSATTVSDTALAADDVVGLTIAGLTGTATISGAATSAALATIATDMAAAWNAVATTTNTLYNVVASGSNITVTASATAGSRADNGAIAVLFSTGTDTSTHPMVGYKIGYDRATTDNKTLSTKVIVTVMSNGSGTDADARQSGAITWTQAVSATLLSNATTYTAAPSFDQYHASALSDTVSAVTEFTGTKNAGTDVNVNYLGWLK